MRRTWLLTLGQGLKLNHESSSHPSLAWIHSRIWHLEGLGRCFRSLRASEVRVKSAALNRGGEGVFIAPPQKLAVVEVLCAYQNFRPMVGTSDQFKFTRPRGFYRKLHGTSEGWVGIFDPRSELTTQVFSAGRGPFVGQYTTLPMGSELPTPTVFFMFSACACIVSRNGWMVSFLDTIASQDRSFASLLIVRYFIYSNSKIEINKTRQ